jgi:hypothetical protein
VLSIELKRRECTAVRNKEVNYFSESNAGISLITGKEGNHYSDGEINIKITDIDLGLNAFGKAVMDMENLEAFNERQNSSYFCYPKISEELINVVTNEAFSRIQKVLSNNKIVLEKTNNFDKETTKKLIKQFIKIFSVIVTTDEIIEEIINEDDNESIIPRYTTCIGEFAFTENLADYLPRKEDTENFGFIKTDIDNYNSGKFAFALIDRDISAFKNISPINKYFTSGILGNSTASSAYITPNIKSNDRSGKEIPINENNDLGSIAVLKKSMLFSEEFCSINSNHLLF